MFLICSKKFYFIIITQEIEKEKSKKLQDGILFFCDHYLSVEHF
jgi:hypothetical protein